MPRRYCSSEKEKKVCACAMLSLYRFVEPLALFALKHYGPAHGYELLSFANQHIMTETPIDGPAFYRTLRVLEHHGHITSNWKPGIGGPRRRQYSLTQKGELHFLEWRTVLSRLHLSLGRFIGEIDGEKFHIESRVYHLYR